MKNAALLAVALVALPLLTACGKKGDLKPPPGSTDTLQRCYPPGAKCK